MVTVKFLDRNSSSGTKGCADRFIRNGNATAETAPIARARYGRAPCQFCCWPMMAPKLRPPTARKITVAPSQSKWLEACSSLDSGTCPSVAYSATTRRGRLMKKAARHEIPSTRSPPTNGPRMVVAAEAPAHRPKALPCSSPSNVEVMMAREPGTSSAPAAPWRTRKAIRSSMLGASPQSSDVAPNPARPTANIRLRP